MSRLRLHQISKSFPGVKALQDVNIEIQAGEIHALCGENGAGKSTLMNILAGNLQPEHGEIQFDNHTIQLQNPRDAFKYGIALVYQHLSLVESLSVAENIFANQQPLNRLGLINYDRLREMTFDLLHLLGMDSIQPGKKVSELSTPEKQLVEIAKALSKKPAILILDEPTASLTDRETTLLFQILMRLRSDGTAIIYISHRLEEVFQLADRVSILKDGKSQGTFPLQDLDKQNLIRLMLGREITTTKTQSSATGEVLLQVRNYTSERFMNISLQLHRGEILGLAGLVGAGRTEIARAIFGADGIDSGELSLSGKLIKIDHPIDAMANGIAYVPEDRKSLGLFAEMSIQDNMVVAALQKEDIKIYNRSRSGSISQSYTEKLHISSPDLRKKVVMLSGGNQQKVLLAKWLLTNPEVLIIDEPTHGVDVGAKFEIYEILKSLARQGKGILIISSELPELMGLCDRIMVIRKGKVAGELNGPDATEEQLLELAAN